MQTLTKYKMRTLTETAERIMNTLKFSNYALQFQEDTQIRKHIFQVSSYQMCILMLFNAKETLTYEVQNDILVGNFANALWLLQTKFVMCFQSNTLFNMNSLNFHAVVFETFPCNNLNEKVL